MQLGDGNLLALAGAIADGNPVDWDLAESSAGDGPERQIIQQLRRLADLSVAARAHTPTWGPFTIRGEMGGGTFGAVYRAWDPRLEREVALKLLHHSDDSQAEAAVIREARLLAKVQHPNVVTVHGADVVDGRVGIWMELIEGRTLKDLLQANGPFGAHEAALIGRDLCRALAAVHRLECVHRDVKAQNVMRQAGGRIVLMDFGAGGAFSDAPGRLAGTPAYLAPEVLAGAPHTPQSDLYSVGVLLYHLVSGAFPAVADSLDGLRAVHERRETVPLRDVRPDVPDAFVRVVERATAPSPSARPRSAGALEELLNEALATEGGTAAGPAIARSGRRWRWAVAAGLGTVLAVGAGVAAVTWRTTPAPAAAATRSSVAILPFRNLTPADGDALSDGITDELAAHLGLLNDLRVISGASARRFRDRSKPETEVGTALGVAAVFDGSIRREGDRIRIVGRLVDSGTGEQLWSESFESDTTDLFTTQSAIARKIAVALRGELTHPDADRLGGTRQRDYEAFALYSKGRYYWALRTEDGLNKSLVYFQQAIARDPQYGLAYAGLADTYTYLGLYGGLSRSDANAKAFEAARTAVALAPDQAEAYAALAYAQKNRFEWPAAEASFKRAIQLGPNVASTRAAYSVFLTQHARFGEALTEARTALSLDPLSFGANLQFGSLLVMSRRYGEALKQYDVTRQIDPGVSNVHRFTAAPLIYLRRFHEAEQALRRARRATGIGAEDQELQQDLGYLYAVSGRRPEAERIVAALKQRFEVAGEPLAGSVAAIYTGLGNTEQALAWLQRARQVQDLELGYLKVDPRWDPLRTDPRFQRLLRDLGLASPDHRSGNGG